MGILSMLPSLNKIIAGLGAAYLCNTLYSLYVLYHPKLCTEASTKCLPSALARKGDDLYMDRFQLRVYTYTPSMSHFALILKQESLSLTDDEFSSTVAITIPQSVSVHNGSLLCAAYLMPDSCAADDLQPESGCKWFVRRDAELTKYALPTPDAYSLLGEAKEPEREIQSETNDESVADQPVVHLRSLIPLTAVAEPHSFDFYQVPREIAPLLKLTYNSKSYYPLFYMDHVSFRMRDLLKIPPKVKTMNVTVSLKRVTIGKLIMLVNAFNSMHQLKNLGFSDKDCDEVTGIFTDTSFLLLMTTVCVSTIHLILDILAFKNDIHFWRKRKTMVGLSRRTLIWRCFSNTIISAYLYDTGASLLVLAPAMFGTLVEYWKVTKALKVHVSWPSGSRTPRVTFGDSSEAELETEAFDSQGMSYLAVLMTPLCIAGAIYSLVYEPHKSWYSWCVQSLANGVYAFGFLFMLPQLFVNYKLKSVAHLPWRAFVYKAVNTFIDDLFAFIIHMPTAHRLACFRDDVVFVVYLVQLYLYPVDWSRVNEYGESFEDNKSDKKDKTD